MITRGSRKYPRSVLRAGSIVLSLVALVLVSCGGGSRSGPRKSAIQMKGSDTMVNLAQAWAEEYSKVDTTVTVEVSGGGSGVGVAALIRGTIDVASVSRDMKSREKEQAKQHTGKEVREFTVGYDALAVYVHKDNPMERATLDQLAGIYAEGGEITEWSQLGLTIPGAGQDEIVRVSRQSSSGTYEFFREHVLENTDFKLGSRDMNGSKEVVELVGATPTAIGYSGMGYATSHVKMLRVAASEGDSAYAPTLENTVEGNYGLARSLHLYTLGEPEGALKRFIEWTLSDAGQRIVAETGYVPVTSATQADTTEADEGMDTDAGAASEQP